MEGFSRRVRESIARLWSDQGAITAVELALVAAFVLVPLLLGTVELGRNILTRMQLDNAASAGVEYAIAAAAAGQPFNATSISTAVTSATSLTGSTVGMVTPITATPAPSQACMCPTVTGLVAASGTPPSCSGTCSSGGAPGTYVTVTAATSYTPLFHSCGGLLPANVCPLSGTATTYSSTAVARIQ